MLAYCGGGDSRRLQTIDPLFTRDLPRTEKALGLYARYIDKFLDTKNRPEPASGWRADKERDAAGNRTIAFKAVKLSEARPSSR